MSKELPGLWCVISRKGRIVRHFTSRASGFHGENKHAEYRMLLGHGLWVGKEQVGGILYASE